MTLQREYFGRLYAASDDPWRLRERWYERRKRAMTLAALSKPRYASGFEPGCSVGELSAGLATRCGALLVSDLDPTACRSARQRLGHFPHVRVEQLLIPQEWPEASFDLIVISELGYYLNDVELNTDRPCVELAHSRWNPPRLSLAASGGRLSANGRRCARRALSWASAAERRASR